MRENLLVEEFEKSQTAKRKGTEQAVVGQSGGSASGTRRTRSQAAPEWTAQDALILVYEISAVEGECANALSTYQKWTMVAENCAALDVARTSHQCRRKWDSLLMEYKMIVEWEKQRKGMSYWSLDSGRRKKAGLPLDFTEDLYKAINEVVEVREERSGTETDTDSEAEFDVAISKETGFKKVRRQANHHKGVVLEEKDTGSAEVVLPQRTAPRKGITKEREHLSMENESQRRSALYKGINEGKVHASVSTENQLQCQPTSYQGFSTEMEHVSLDNEPLHQRVPHRVIVEEIEHLVLENESRSQSTSCQSTPYGANTKANEHVSVEYESQNVSNPPKENSEEKELAPVGNKSCYQLSPAKVITKEEDRALLQIEPWCQSAPNKQVPGEMEHVSTKKKCSNVPSGAEERKQLLAAKLRENTQLIHAIIAGNSSQNSENMPTDMKYDEALEIQRARQKADKLIACIADLAKNLDLLNNAVEECQGKTV